jgi:hypothetical protein
MAATPQQFRDALRNDGLDRQSANSLVESLPRACRWKATSIRETPTPSMAAKEARLPVRVAAVTLGAGAGQGFFADAYNSLPLVQLVPDPSCVIPRTQEPRAAKTPFTALDPRVSRGRRRLRNGSHLSGSYHCASTIVGDGLFYPRGTSLRAATAAGARLLLALIVGLMRFGRAAQATRRAS